MPAAQDLCDPCRQAGLGELFSLPPEPTPIAGLQLVQDTYGEEGKGRAYSYFSAERLQVGDVVKAPIKEGWTRAMVMAVDVPEETILAFRDKVKTICAGSVITRKAPHIEVPPIIHEAGMPRDIPPVKEAEVVFKEIPVTAQEKAFIQDRQANVDMILNAGVSASTAVIKVAPQEEEAVQKIYAEARTLLGYAVARTIRSDADLAPATNDLAVIAGLKKSIEAKRIEYTRPIEAHKNMVMEWFKKFTSPLTEAREITEKKVLAYNALRLKQKQEAEAIEAEKMAMARREAALNEGVFTVPLDTVPVVSEAPKTVRRSTTTPA